MELFNPHDAAKRRGRGRPPKNPPPDPVPAACVWEALRHNETFAQDVEAIRETGTTLVPERWDITHRVHKHAHEYARMALGCLVPATRPDECDAKPEPKPRLCLTQPWPKTPEWFRRTLVRLCTSSVKLATTKKTEGDTLAHANLADQLCAMLTEPDGIARAQLSLLELRERLVVLPAAICESQAEVDEVLEQIRPLVKKVHGHRNLYPSRTNWECFLEFCRGKKEDGYGEGRVIRKFAPRRYRKLREEAGKFAEGVSLKAELDVIKADILEMVQLAKPGVIKQVDTVKEFISRYYLEPKPA